MESVMEKNIVSFFAGVGGIDLGFEESGDYHTAYANEFDPRAQQTFEANFKKRGTKLDKRDIRDVSKKDIEDTVENVDALLAGFPCQPFSVAGFRQGFDDDRGDLFFETNKLIKSLQPNVVFLENVKNLVTHDKGNTFKVIREYLVQEGYYVKWKVLNAKDYANVPQNRERIYVVGFKNKESFEKFDFPEKVQLTTTLQDVIDFDAKEGETSKFGDELYEKFFYKKGKQPFYDVLAEEMTSSNTVYQWRRQYVRENKSNVVPTLTANMGTGGHNVPLIRTHNGDIRKLTPRETFNVQGYPIDYVLPKEEPNSALYKQAGNSVVVPLIKRIATNINVAEKNVSDNNVLPETDGKSAIVYTKMVGKMEGESYSLNWYDSKSQIKDDLQKLEEETNIPAFTDEDFFKAIKRGCNTEFYSVVG